MQIKASTIFTTYFPIYYFRFVCFIRSYFKYHISFNTDAVIRQTCVLFYFLGIIYVNETWTRTMFDYGRSYVLEVLAENGIDTTGIRLSATATVTLFITGVS